MLLVAIMLLKWPVSYSVGGVWICSICAYTCGMWACEHALRMYAGHINTRIYYMKFDTILLLADLPSKNQLLTYVFVYKYMVRIALTTTLVLLVVGDWYVHVYAFVIYINKTSMCIRYSHARRWYDTMTHVITLKSRFIVLSRRKHNTNHDIKYITSY